MRKREKIGIERGVLKYFDIKIFGLRGNGNLQSFPTLLTTNFNNVS